MGPVWRLWTFPFGLSSVLVAPWENLESFRLWVVELCWDSYPSLGLFGGQKSLIGEHPNPQLLGFISQFGIIWGQKSLIGEHPNPQLLGFVSQFVNLVKAWGLGCLCSEWGSLASQHPEIGNFPGTNSLYGMTPAW
jgi:hypothetical protein